MKRVPNEVDQLMWIVAEEGDTRAVEEFETRHPEYKYELAHRISMVRQLKGAGSKTPKRRELPPFVPVDPPRLPITRPAAVGVGALCLAALAMATYTVVTFLEPPRPPTPAPKPVAVESSIEIEPKPEPVAPAPTVQTPTPQPPVQPTPKYLQPQDLKIEKAPLLAALELIAEQGGVRLTVGEGVSNPEIKISYTGRTTMEMLKDLGRQYAFTPFDEGDGTILIIPAVDPAEKKTETHQPVDLESGVKTLPKGE